MQELKFLVKFRMFKLFFVWLFYRSTYFLPPLRKRFSHLQDRIVLEKLGSLRIAVTVRNLRVLKEIFLDNEYAIGAERRSLKTVLDVGANVGYFLLWLLYNDFLARGAKVICCEPSKRNFKLLKTNVKLNSRIIHSKKIKVVLKNVAICGKRGRVRFVDDYMWSRISAAGDYFVDCETLEDNLFPHTDLIKVDVEGAEYEIFKHFHSSDKVSEIIGELHSNKAFKLFEKLFGGRFVHRKVAPSRWLFSVKL